ncbi:MAG: low temperature requirement protein A [Woeseiaceae bacterium]|nr:low temperature requirement protein A [Woeseiaceae bacterium]
MTNSTYRNLLQTRPMRRRDSNEVHRASTPLELLFDLVSVIAIATAAAGLHHAIAEAHFAEGIAKFILSFFAIWWAWMNYTWFASAYDNDDAMFRILTMIIMSGSLVMAAGIGAFFESLDITLMVIGYVIMRLGMVALWLRAAAGDSEGRPTALTYARGFALTQVFWIILLIVLPIPTAWFYGLFGLGMILELVVPVIAENRGNTPWHRHHMIERYGLLNIIVLGETLLAASLAIEAAQGEHLSTSLIRIAIAALVILFAMWWLYFAREEHLERTDFSRALVWGYGHVLIYASGAAVGAGIAVAVEIATHHAHVAEIVGNYAIAVPVAVYTGGLWLVRDRYALNRSGRFVLPTVAIVVLILAAMPFAIEMIALSLLLATVLRSHLACAENSSVGSVM